MSANEKLRAVPKVTHGEEEYCKCGDSAEVGQVLGDFGYREVCWVCGKQIEDGFHYYNHSDGADHDDIDLF